MHRVVAIALLLAAATSWADEAADELRLARYTTTSVAPDPDTSSPLAVIATVRFPREQIRTVGDAVEYLLLRTGYRLDSLDSAARALLALPLPESHRELGPYRAQAMLQLLVGEAYEVEVSEVDRTLAIALRPLPPSSTPDAAPLSAAGDQAVSAAVVASESRQ